MTFASITFSRRYFYLVLSLLASYKATARDFPERKSDSQPISAILVFGDSTVDPGNNNYINTLFKSNFSPYGKDFANHTSTGRFTNGRLANDFIAKYIGLKEYVPPYLDPNLSIEELMTGVSFASAGSGYDPLTPVISSVISFSEQLEHFKSYRAKLETALGKDRTMEIVKNALFLVSAGTNDFVVNYFSVPIRRNNYTISKYTSFVLQEARQVLQGLVDQGATRIGVVGLPPMGCLPIVITLFSEDPIANRECITKFSSIARDYNSMLQNELNDMQKKLQPSGSRIAYVDIFGPLEEMTLGNKYDFEEVRKGCCGTGLLEASYMCNSKSLVCEDVNEYVFWDAIHPTEKTYFLLFQEFRPLIDSLVKE
ncbi:GDSL esterase/lipase [Striga hermonthica]|uniref:GDSL esterase/lipase n=1 Tax=Striga hermonthica TaxID=68872 RepID=A0A9N7MYL8_STRHE|nr:GDSL esterase/lipase [Striga hermonthica]